MYCEQYYKIVKVNVRLIVVSEASCMTTVTTIKPWTATQALWVSKYVNHHTIQYHTLLLIGGFCLAEMEGVDPSNCVIGVVASGCERRGAAYFVCIFHQHKFLAA